MRRGRWLLPCSAGLAMAFGCNAILDNRRGQLATTDGGAVEPPDATSPIDAAPIDAATEAPPTSAEPPDASPPAQAPVCSDTQKLCGDTCVDSADPAFGCLATRCTPCALDNAETACDDERCVIASCKGHYGDCNGEPSDGCEQDLSQATSCGDCGVVCPRRAPVCSLAPGATAFTCETGCPGARPMLCDGACVDPESDDHNCGKCGTKCRDAAHGTASCDHGACKVACNDGFHACDERCVANADATACGATCARCPAPANGTASCVDGACAATCARGFADCDGVATNGCEAALDDDALHCGACDNACDGGTCEHGTCAPVDKPDADADDGFGLGPLLPF